MAPKILIVLTSCDRIEAADRDIGWWLSELAHPYTVLEPKTEITVASPKGGCSPVDPHSTDPPHIANDPISTAFLENKSSIWENTIPLSAAASCVADFDAIFFPGGHGPMFDIATDPISIQLVKDFYSTGKVVAAVCHGPAAFVNVTFPDGKHILADKTVTGFTNAEEDIIGTTQSMPFLLEDQMREKSGGGFKGGASFEEHIEIENEGKFITGQNPYSAKAVGEAILRALGV